MNASFLYRASSVLLALFAVGHTLGFLKFKPASSEGLAVRESMTAVQFEFKGKRYSYGRFYRGFGLTITAYLLFSAFLAWHLSAVAATQPQTTVALAWAFAAVQAACLVLSVLYFFIAPAVLSGVLVVCLFWAAWLVSTTGA